MSERNAKMAAMLADTAPARRDTAFEIAVLARIEQNRFRRAVAGRLVAALLAAGLLALVMPPLHSLWQPLWQQGLDAASRMLPQGVSVNLALGVVLMAASLAWARIGFPLSREWQGAATDGGDLTKARVGP